MKRKLLFTTLLFITGIQFLMAQADHISWVFRGGYYGNNAGILIGPGEEPAGLDVAEIPDTSISKGWLQSAVLGDLDNDGDLDFISGSQGGTLHYFENRGNRTAPNWVAASIPTLDTIWIDRTLTQRNQNRPKLIDIDDDGDLDLFVGTDFDYNRNRNNDVLFYRNIGSAETPVFEFVPENLPGLYNQEVCEFPGLGFVDIDNDGDYDLIMMGSDTLTYFKNIGSKTNPIFERQSEADSPWDSSSVAAANMDVPIPVFEDFDRDGDYDMFFMADSGIVYWIENTGTKEQAYFGTTQRTMNGALQNTVIGSFPVVDFGDVDGDGLKDAIFGTFNVPRFAWFRQVPVCISPETPTITATPVSCEGETSTITISGDLNIASKWAIYTDSCGGNLIGAPTTNTSTFDVIPSAPSTTYYIRAEDGDISCIDESVTTCFTVTINVAPLDDPSFNYNAAQYCKDAENPTPSITGLAGGQFTSSAGLSIDPETGVIDLENSTAGEYAIRYTTNGTCSNFSEATITITELDDASFNYDAAQYCKDSENPIPTITGLAGGQFTSSAGLTINPDTGVINLENSTAGEYTIRYTTNGTCINFSEVTITITDLDNPSFNYDAAQYCKDAENPSPSITGLAGGQFTSSSGLTIDPDTGVIDLENSTAAEYTIRYTTNGTCSNFSEVTITITDLDDASFNYNAAQYCKDAENPTPSIIGLAGGQFTSSAGLTIDPNTGVIDLENSTAGEYTIRYITNGTCINFSEVTITITDLDNPSFNYDAAQYCKDAENPTPSITGLVGGQFTSSSGLTIDPDTGVIDLENSTAAEYTIRYTTNGTCSNFSEVTITITDLDDPSFNYDAAQYCKDSENPIPTITGLTGGIFTNSTGLSIDPNTGLIDLENSPTGEHIIRYTTNGICSNFSEVTLTITVLDDATFNYDESVYCMDSSNPLPTITGLAGGTFTSTVGLSIDSETGSIDINNSAPGDYDITYSTDGTCSNSSQFAITILDVNNPDISHNYTEYSIDGDAPHEIEPGEVITVPEGINLELHVPEVAMGRTVIWTAPNNQTYTSNSVLLQSLRDGLDLEGEWSLHIIFDNSCSLADQTITFDIEVDPALSVPDLETDDLVIYPNPFQNSVTIQTPMNLSEVDIRVIDIAGRNVYSDFKKNNNESTITIELNHLSKGVYFLVLKQEDHSVVKRIVKQ